MNAFLRNINAVFLAGILLILIVIYRRMPPTLGDFRGAKGDAATALNLRLPVLHCTFQEPISVEVNNDIRNSSPDTTEKFPPMFHQIMPTGSFQ